MWVVAEKLMIAMAPRKQIRGQPVEMWQDSTFQKPGSQGQEKRG